MPLFHKIGWILLISAGISRASERHMICKDVVDVFSPAVESPFTSDAVPSRGLPGKRGPQGDIGPPGIQGPQGLPGVVDYQRVTDIAKDGITNELGKISPRLDAIEDFVTRIKDALCQVKHENKCYWVVFLKTNYLQAKTLCAQFGAKPANVYSQAHYDKLFAYVRRAIPETTAYIEPWLGMTINTLNLQVTLRDGTTAAPYLKWYRGYPTRNAGHTQINLQVRPNPTTTQQNMWNYSPEEVRDGVICEF